MKRNYRFYGKEAQEPTIWSFEFEGDFYEQVDKELKEIYGEDLTFVKEINHSDRIIRLHSGYDSGKGTLYVPPKKRKKQRERLPKRLQFIIDNQSSNVLKLENEYQGENLMLIFHRNSIEIFKNGTFKNGYVSGIRFLIINRRIESILKCLKNIGFYPYQFEYLK